MEETIIKGKPVEILHASDSMGRSCTLCGLWFDPDILRTQDLGKVSCYTCLYIIRSAQEAVATIS